ncbi:hypothetical protein TRVL_05340 [Trypanosoma vivax]|nr:hypothetical protein TRVL_05340 [Trypanosoma vivax]
MGYEPIALPLRHGAAATVRKTTILSREHASWTTRPERPLCRRRAMAVWSSGMIPALGAGGHGFNSRNGPFQQFPLYGFRTFIFASLPGFTSSRNGALLLVGSCDFFRATRCGEVPSHTFSHRREPASPSRLLLGGAAQATLNFGNSRLGAFSLINSLFFSVVIVHLLKKGDRCMCQKDRLI